MATEVFSSKGDGCETQSLGWDQLLVGQHHLNLSACPFPSRCVLRRRRPGVSYKLLLRRPLQKYHYEHSKKEPSSRDRNKYGTASAFRKQLFTHIRIQSCIA
ncbi:hypothetical protein Q5P01_012689 [Channa striata]|uniref:Uncharacterized protein n=1 Tax=Channa striata TaxID=64152 RepID=A0AA88MST9_CHASR|nr:hypothetical protein Q5P01_012689 [Channa striata]